MIPPIILRYEGEGAFQPASPYMARLADRHYVIGETYPMAEHHERSMRSHNHYFASLADAWGNLPDALLEEYPTAEHLRKKLLIRAGFATHTDYTLDTPRDAITLAAILARDKYSIVEIKGPSVRHWQAESQSIRAMGAKRFQASKSAVFAEVDKLLAVAPGETERNAGRAA